LNLCRTNKLGEVRSISIPILSSGNYGGPLELCCKILLSTCIEWSSRPNTGKLQEIFLCAILDEQVAVFTNEL
jgi:O-acetyl-ADP-ribose deacetylase (regulator of RNase III)